MKSAVTSARPFLPMAVALLLCGPAPVPAAGFDFAAIGDLPYSETDSLRFPLLRERIDAEDLAIESRPREGRAIAGSPLATVALDTVLTPELLAEGRYRELLNRVQNFRKDLDLPYVARIRVGLAGTDGDGSLLAVAREREAHFLNETLSVELVAGELPGAERRAIEVEGESATLCLEVIAG